ncbi:MAG: hypothetical protein AAF656_02365, partial [Planctomycetota bacterium]
SMIKRNLGSHLRSRSTRRREQEMLLRAVVHNVMILRRLKRGLRLSPMVAENSDAAATQRVKATPSVHVRPNVVLE